MRIEVAGYRGPVGDIPTLLKAVQAHAARHSCELQLLNADLVMGRDHLVSAALHAVRAFEEGRAAAATRPLETLRFASGERQISKALQKLGLAPAPRAHVAAVALGDGAAAALATLPDAFGWARDDAVLAPKPDALAAYGVTPEERATLPPERWPDLVLERVALVDIMK